MELLPGVTGIPPSHDSESMSFEVENDNLMSNRS